MRYTDEAKRVSAVANGQLTITRVVLLEPYAEVWQSYRKNDLHTDRMRIAVADGNKLRRDCMYVDC